MSTIGRVDAISTLIEPPETLRDAPIEVIREALRQNRDVILESIAQAIYREFVSTPRVIHSVQEAAEKNRVEAAAQFRKKIHLLTH